MKIVIAPDAFKECLNPIQVATAIEYGLRMSFPDEEIIRVPCADGGEGTLLCLQASTSLSLHTVVVSGPLGNKRKAHFGSFPGTKTAVIEMAEASGLSLVPVQKRNILMSSTFGVGELIKAALDQGFQTLIICLGGSATCDAGIGALSALGVQFRDRENQPLSAIPLNLGKIAHIDTENLDSRLEQTEIILAHDVNNPLLGLEGALMYAPQKGATPEEVEILHKGLEAFHFVLSKTTHKNVGNIPGGGAAGGLGAGIDALLNARFERGASLIMHYTGMLEKLADADLVITAEAKIDRQTLHGKTVSAVAKLAHLQGIPVIALAATLEEGYDAIYHEGVDAVFSIVTGPMSKEESMANTKGLLIQTAHNIGRLIKIGKLL